MEIEASPDAGASFQATLKHVNGAGPKVNVELERQWGDTVHAEVDQDHFRQLEIQPDADVYLEPRENHVFILPDAPYV